MTLQDIIDFIIGLVQSAVQFLIDVINFLINAINVIFGFLWNTLVAFARFLGGIFQSIGQFFLKLWTNYIKPAIQGILKIYHDIRARLQAIFGPILKIIARVRAWFYLYIYPWIKLAQQIISTVRVFLSALRLLGVKWAAKLDAELQKIQSYITTGLQAVVGTLNQLSTWLNFAIDPFGLVRKDVLNGSLFMQIPTLRNAMTFGNNRALTASEQQNTQDDRAMLGGGAAILTRNQDGSVTYSAASQRVNDGYSAGWQAYGGTTAIH